MKKGLLALGLMIASASVVSTQPQQQPPAWTGSIFGSSANVVHDFGIVPHGELLHHDFVITNIYAVPMEITELITERVTTVTTTKHILQPKEQAIISVTMDARRFVGKRASVIRVTFGPTYNSTTTFTVKADSRNELVFNPGAVAFGSVAPGQIPSEIVDIEYAGKLEWQVSEAVVPKEAPFEAAVKELYRRPGEVGYQVKVSLKKDAAPGQFWETIYLKTNDPSAGLLPLLVSGKIQSSLEAAPEALNLNEVNSGEALTRRVVLRGTSPFNVIGIEGSGAVTLGGEPPLLNQRRVQTVTLEIVPPPQEGPFRYEVRIKTDLQDKPVAVVIEGVVPKK